MSIVARFAESLQRFDRKFWPAHRVVLNPLISELLLQNPLVIADVGAVGGPEARWLELQEHIHFLTFDPLVPPSANAPDERRSTNFQAALGAKPGPAVLRLMKDSHASTICEPHSENFADFVIHKGLEQTGAIPLELDSLDHCIESRPDLTPHVLKIDVEGADLDVLRGAVGALDRSVLAVRVEVSFIERHRDAPFFGDTDAFLRAHGFQLFQLSREMWLRNNLAYGYTSEPQIAWGDAVYFLNRRDFMSRLQKLASAERPALLAKFVVVLLSFGVHDYAVELIETALQEQHISTEAAHGLNLTVQKSIDGSPLFVVKSFAGVLFAGAIWLVSLPLAGARQRAGFYVKQRAGHLFRLLWRMTARGGPERSCISD